MMSEDVITDLKQFITAIVSQATTDLVTKSDLEASITASEQRILQHLNYVQDAIAETLTSAIEDLHKTSHNHEKRITTLERKLA